MIDFLYQINQSLTQFTGSITIVFIGILIILIIGFLMAGMDFKFALLMCFPLVAYLTSKGIGNILPGALGAVFWIVIIGLGLYLLWNIIQEKVYF